MLEREREYVIEKNNEGELIKTTLISQIKNLLFQENLDIYIN